MQMSIRRRLLAGSCFTVIILLGLLGLVLLSQARTNDEIAALDAALVASREARELSLYVQYNAHDTDAYTLGHLEHRQEFDEHRAAFTALIDRLRARLGGGFAPAMVAQLDTISQTRASYDTAASALFAAAHQNRTQPSPAASTSIA